MADGIWVIGGTLDGFGEDGDGADGGLQFMRDVGDEVSAGFGKPDVSGAVRRRDDRVAVPVKRAHAHGEDEVGSGGCPLQLHGVDNVAVLSSCGADQIEEGGVGDS